MRVVILQPPYPHAGSAEAALECMRWMADRLAALAPGGQDLVLLPEYANAPGIEEGGLLAGFTEAHGTEFARALAGRAGELGCLVAAGLVCRRGAEWVNRTVLFGPAGEVAAYDKTHLTGVEASQGLSPGSAVVAVAHNGVRYGFATCLDVYFAEFLEALAARGVDVILHPSYQRSETPERIRLLSQCRALDAGATVVRAAYAMGRPDRGGHSLVAAPDGSLVAEAGADPGVLSCAFDPAAEFRKPASHGQPLVEHRALIESHRRPGLLRPAQERAAALRATPFPWVCAHRGLSSACPENTLPALAAALAFPVQEVEIDLWLSRDGVPVVCHDPDVARTTDGRGIVMEMEWAEIRRLDAGIRLGEAWRGVRMPRFEEVLDLVDGRVGLNLHIKNPGPGGALVRQVCAELRSRALVDRCYLAGDADVLRAGREIAPEIPRACLALQDQPDRQIALAVEMGCRRLQFYRQATAEHCRKAHDLGLICNLFWSDDPEDARAYVARGIDVVLTNAAHWVNRESVSSE